MNYTSMNIIDQAVNKGAEYADVRHDVKRVYTLIRENQRTTSSEVQINAGYCLRVLVNGCWGTGAVTNEQDLPSLLQAAITSAKAQKRKEKVTVKTAPSTTVKSEEKGKIRFVDADTTDLVTGVEAAVYDQSNRISSTSVSITAVERFMEITTSEQRIVKTRVDRTKIRVGVACKEGNTIESRVKNWGDMGGMEALLNMEDTILKECTQITREADILVDANHAPSATMDCVLCSILTGTLLHEAFGHGVEADLVVSNESLLSQRIGEKVAADCITMRDDPTEPLFGHYTYDHEGVKAQPTTIVENGVLTSFLHSRETASTLHSELTGHCKAEFFSYAPIVRQGNTILEPGDYTDEELLTMKNGLFLGDSAGGQVNVGDGTFTFGTQYAREIKNGEFQNYLKGCSLSGHILETMKKVDAIGKNRISGPGGCGKGQMDLQGRLVPNIRLQEVMIGGRGR
jgi:TldD protein